MPYDRLPTVDELEDADSQLERVRESINLSLKERVDDVELLQRSAQATRDRYAKVRASGRAYAEGDTLRTIDDFLGALSDKKRAAWLKKREDRVPAVHLAPIPFGEASSSGYGLWGEASSAAYQQPLEASSKSYGQPLNASSEAYGQPLDASSEAYDPDRRREKEDRKRAMMLPGSPVGYADNLSSVRLLELWQTRPMSDLTAAIEKLGKMDRFAGNAIMNSPSARTDAQRAEIKRLINSEWRIDLTFAGHDFALPSVKRAPTLNPVQAKLVETVMSVATRSVLAERNRLDGFSMREPLGGYLSPSTSFNVVPSRFHAMVAKANWALGIHGDRRSLLDIISDVVAPDKDSWSRDQLDFLSSWISPSSRDELGEHRTLLDLSLASHRTMLNMRALFGGAPQERSFSGPGGPSTKLVFGSDGRPAFIGTLDESDPLYNRSFFTPSWEKVSDRHMWDVVIKSDSVNFPFDAMAASTNSYPKVLNGFIFDPYSQEVTPIRTSGVAGLIGKNGPRILHNVEDDHIVALKYAWDRGFRELFLRAAGDPVKMAKVAQLAADFGTGRGAFSGYINLTYTQKDINRDKSDKDLTRWLPPFLGSVEKQRAAALFYTNSHMRVMDSLRSRVSEIYGMDPNLFPTSLGEQRVIERVLRGYMHSSDTMIGRAQNEAQLFFLQNFLQPDLSEDAFYLQARQSALLTYANLGWNSATWRLSLWNQAYLLGRKWVVPYMNRFWMKATGDPALKDWHHPEHIASLRSRGVRGAAHARRFMYGVRSQGTSEFIGAINPSAEDALQEIKHGIVAPTFSQSVRYAAGAHNPFGADLSSGALPLWRAQKMPGFDEFAVDHLRRFLETGDAKLLAGAPYWFIYPPSLVRSKDFEKRLPLWQANWVSERRKWIARSFDPTAHQYFGSQYRMDFDSPGSWAFSDDGVRYSDEAVWRHLDEIRQSIFDGALRDFSSSRLQSIAPVVGRQRLDATPLLGDLARIWGQRGEKHASVGRTVSRMGGAVFADLGVKAGDYGLRGFLEGNSGQLVSNFKNLISIDGIEFLASLAASKSGQMVYQSPAIARMTLLSNDPFAPFRYLGRRRWRALPAAFKRASESFRFTGGLDRFRGAWNAAADADARALGLRGQEMLLSRLVEESGGASLDALLYRERALKKELAPLDVLGLRKRLAELEASEVALRPMRDIYLGRYQAASRAAWGSAGINPSLRSFTEGSGREARTRWATGRLWGDVFAPGQRPSARVQDLFERAFEAERELDLNLIEYNRTARSLDITRRRLNKLTDKNVAISGKFDGEFDRVRRELDILGDQIAAAREVPDVSSHLQALTARHAARWDAAQLPDVLREAVNPSMPRFQRTLLDLQASNPRTGMALARGVHAPLSIVRGVGAVGKAFTVDAWTETILRRRGVLESVRLDMKHGMRPAIGLALRTDALARTARYGLGYGLSAVGVFESMSRWDKAESLLMKGTWDDLSMEERADLLGYANRSMRTRLLDVALPAATADLPGVAVGATNAAFSGLARRWMYRWDDYASENAKSILAGRPALRDQYERDAKLERLRQNGIFLASEESGADALVRHYRERTTIQTAAINRLKLRQASAHTEKQIKSSSKALRGAALKTAWMKPSDMSDSAWSVFQRDADSVGRVSMPVYTSRPYDATINARALSRLDSLEMFGRLNPADTALQRVRIRERKRIQDSTRNAADYERTVLEPLDTEATPGFFGQLVKRENVKRAREQLAARSQVMRDAYSRQATTRLGRNLLRLFPGLLPGLDAPLGDTLSRLERHELAKDTIQAAQRRRPK